MYDWANSAFATSIGAAILPVYFVTLFRDAFGDDASFLGFTLTGSSMWGLGVAVSTAIVALSSPLLGVIADRTRIKKTLLWIYASAGVLFTVLSFFSVYTGAPWAWVLGCFVIANIGFAGGNVFYNSFLPHLAPRELLNDVSSRGFAYGYLGGGILLAAHLVAILAFRDTDHVDLVTRLAVASVGVWWFGWGLWMFKTVPEPAVARPTKGLSASRAARIAFSELSATFRELTRFRVLVLYLVAYLLFTDGTATILAVAGAFGPETLGISLEFNVATILIVQFVAAPGAMLFSRLAGFSSTKNALAVALVGWCVVVALAVGFAPLEPEAHGDFDYRLQYTTAGDYEVVAEAELSDSREADRDWEEMYGHVLGQETLGRSRARELARVVAESDLSLYSISVKGGPLDGVTGIGPGHPSNLGEGPIDWWPRALRDYLWEPVGLSVDYQWLVLGVLLGVVLGGSQALARSLYAYMTPESRSAEFFGFFGFISRASAVFGPMVYLLFTGVYDTRMAILVVLLIILAGTITLRWVDVEKGLEVASEEDLALRATARPPNG
jgi:UMF1 family MFS transporter